MEDPNQSSKAVPVQCKAEDTNNVGHFCFAVHSEAPQKAFGASEVCRKPSGSPAEALRKLPEACGNSSEAPFRASLPCGVWHILVIESSDRVTLL